MKQSCAGNTIWRQVKLRMARVNYIHFSFILNLRKWKSFLPFYPSNNRTQNNKSSQYTNIRKDYWQGLLRLNFKVIIFRYDLFMTGNSLSNFNLLESLIAQFHTISYWFQKVILLFLSYLSLSEFNAPSWKCENQFASISDT